MRGPWRTAATIVAVLATAHGVSAQEPAQWHVEPGIRIGVALGDPDYEFSNIMGAVRLSDGAVVVGEMDSQEIRFFDSEGVLKTRQGREGEGPGEYVYVRHVLTCGGDRVWVYDTALQRLTILDGEGRLLATHPGPRPDGTTGPYDLRCDRRGRFIASNWGQGQIEALGRGESGPFRGTQMMVLTDSHGATRDTIGTFPGGERYLVRRADGSPGGSGPRALGAETHVAIGRGRAFVGDAATPTVFLYEGAGLDTLDLPLTSQRITDRDLDLVLERRLARASDAAAERRARQWWAEYDFPDAYPFYSDLRVDEVGYLWVRAYPAVGETEVDWLVVHPGGGVVARVRLPEALRVTQIGDDYILGVLTEDGIEVVQQYHLTKGDSR